MKEISQLDLPEIYYAVSHEWARQEDDLIVVGISDYAQDQMGDVVYVELKDVGDTLERAEELGTVESVKAVSEIYAPVAGEVVEVNSALVDDPGLVNQAPYTDGWLVKIKPSDMDNLQLLLNKQDYLANLQGA